jgi:polyprenyl P-hydroxybenzoate/phenylacrylic acid decarboxylase-like protein
MSGLKRLVVGMSGASCSGLGVRLLAALRDQPGWETHLVVSDAAQRTLKHETGLELGQIQELATRTHAVGDIGAAIASGTFRTEGMVVIPCSMKTVAGIAHGYAENLLLRAADVTLKERRRLVLVARETPLGLIHLRNLTELAAMGVTILPPVLTGYHGPASTADMEDHIVGKVLAEFGVEFPRFRRWRGLAEAADGFGQESA